MSNILRRAGVDVPEPVRRFLEGDLESWLRVEEYRDAGSLVIKAQVPGIDPDRDADITVTGSHLELTVRHEEKTEHKDKEGYRSEFRYGTFSRTVTLPAAVDPGEVKASYTDGILEIRVPLPEQGSPENRKIPISRG
jgi:HSP20 family protein